MNVVARTIMTVDEFLLWEERQELRYEFDGVQPIAMVGGTFAHAMIQGNLMFSLTSRLRGRPCKAVGSDMKIAVAGRIRYPDALVVCTRVSPRAKVITDPVVVFEVLSESTRDEDLVVKNGNYRAAPSISSYVVLEQVRVAATIFRRSGEDWLPEPINGEGTIGLPEIGIQIPLTEIYDGVDLADDDDSSEPE